MIYKIPLVFELQPEGGFTVTSPALPGLITEGDTAEEALANVADAMAALREAYEDLGRELPANLQFAPNGESVQFETLLATP